MRNIVGKKILLFILVLPLITSKMSIIVIASPDLIVDNESITISTVETYNNIIVRNGGILTIDASSVTVENRVIVESNSEFQFVELYLNGNCSVSGDSFLQGYISYLSNIYNLTVIDSEINTASSTTVSAPSINYLYLHNSTANLHILRINGIGEIFDTNAILELFYLSTTPQLTITNSNVTLFSSTTSSPDIYDLSCLRSNITIDTIQLLGSLVIQDSIFSGIADYFSNVADLLVENSTVDVFDLEIDGVTEISDSQVILYLQPASYIPQMTLRDSNATILSTTTLSPNIDDLSCVRSNVTIDTIELRGFLVIQDSIFSGFSDDNTYVASVLIENSTIDLFNFDIGGDTDIYNSDVVLELQHTSNIPQLTLYNSNLSLLSTSTFTPNVVNFNCSNFSMYLDTIDITSLFITNSSFSNITLKNTVIDETVITHSNVSFYNCFINFDMILDHSNVSFTDCAIFSLSYDLDFTNDSSLFSQNSLGCFFIWRDSNSTDLLASCLFVLPDATYYPIIKWYNTTSFPYIWVEETGNTIESLTRPGFFYTNFTVPKDFYSKTSVNSLLAIKDVSDNVVWESLSQKTYPISLMIPTIDLLTSTETFWMDTVNIRWNLTGGEIADCFFNLYLVNSSHSILIIENLSEFEYDLDTTLFSDGTYSLDLWCGDFTSSTFSVDIHNQNIPPTITISSPFSYMSYSDEIQIQWSISDVEEDLILVDIHYSSDQVVWYPLVVSSSGTEYLWDISELSNGLYYLRFIASDGTSNVTEIVIIQISHNYAPELTILTPEVNKEYSKEILISWQATDPNPNDILHFSLYYSIDNSSWIQILSNYQQFSYTWDISTLTPGTYYLLVVANDILLSTSAYVGPISIVSPSSASGLSFLITLIVLFNLLVLKRSKSRR